jgi:hypothetical protein
MPAQSEAQRRWAFGVKGAAWAKEHHFDNKGKLPDRKAANARAAKRRLRKKKRATSSGY